MTDTWIDWMEAETDTGSWIALDGSEHIGTVFCRDDEWGGVWTTPDGATLYLAETHADAENAMEAFECGIDEGDESPQWIHPRPGRDQGWTASKVKGGFYRHGRSPDERFAIATVKPARSGSLVWVAALDGERIGGWFYSAREAMHCIDSSACVPRQD